MTRYQPRWLLGLGYALVATALLLAAGICAEAIYNLTR